MILNNRHQDLDIVFYVKVEEFQYILFASSSGSKCFGCGQEGHIIKACPEKEGTSTGSTAAGVSSTGQIDRVGASHVGEIDGQVGGQTDSVVGSPLEEVDRQVRKEGEQGREAGGGREDRQGEEGDQQIQVKESDRMGDEAIRQVEKEISKRPEEVERQGEVSGKHNEEVDRQVEEIERQVVEEADRQVDGQTTQTDKMVEEPKGQGVEGRDEGAERTDRQVEKVDEQVELEDSQMEGVGEQKESMGELEDMELLDEEAADKSPIRLKRKTKSSVGSKQAKKGSVRNPSLQGSSSEGDSDEASEGLQSKVTASQGRAAYSAEKLKRFLQNTKNRKNVRVADFFPDEGRFITSVSFHLKQRELSDLTEQEGFRLKKMVSKLKKRHEGEPVVDADNSC